MTPQRLSLACRLIVRGVSAAVRLLRPIVPASRRDRWTEEWTAEIEHAAAAVAGQRRAALRLLRLCAGLVPDAASLRRLPAPRQPAARSPWLHALGQDFRYSARNIAAAPLFTATIVASLGIGVAVVAGAFAFINAALFPTFPHVADQQRLVEIFIEPSTVDDARLLREAVPEFDALSATVHARLAVAARGQTVSIGGKLVSPNYFDVLGTRMAAGRAFGPSEDRAADAAVAVIGHALWRRLFGGEPSAVGEFITVAGQAIQVVGVAPEGFRGTATVMGARGTEIWLPIGLAPTLRVAGDGMAGLPLVPGQLQVDYVARLARSVSLDQALVTARGAAARIAAAHADEARGGFRRRTFPGGNGFTLVRPAGNRNNAGFALEIAAIMLVPVSVLVVGCINAATMLLALGARRGRETAVRVALGASRWRIVRQLLAECALIALITAAVTMPVLAGILSALERVVPLAMHVDVPVVVCAVAVSLASVVVFGLAPALRVSNVAPGDALGTSRSTSPRSRMRRGLVAVQVALSLGLLATGGQAITGVQHLARVTGARDASTLLMVSFDLGELRSSAPAAESFYSQALENVRRVPGVERVGLARETALWTFGYSGDRRRSAVIVWLPGDPPDRGRYIIGGYAGGDLFEAVGLRLLQGRAFQPEDRTGRPRVALVNRTAANQEFGGAAVGKRVQVAAPGQTYEASHEVTIVGVVEPALQPNYERNDEASTPGLYLPVSLEPETALTLYVRTAGAPAALLPAIRNATGAVDPRVPFTSVGTLADLQWETHMEGRLAAQGLAMLGVLALGLACGGLYGMVSFIASMRRREIGVRLALGALPGGILRLMLKQGMSIALVGAALGGGLATVLSIVLRANMSGVPPVDIAAFALTLALLLAAVALASLVPARSAARVDPLVVLRDE